MGEELQEQFTTLHLLQELQEGEVGTSSYVLVFLCVKYEQPLENRNKTSTDSSKGKNRNTRELCTGKSILFQDLNAMLLQKTGAKKTQPTWQEQREAEPKHSSILSCSISPFREMHTCTIKTSTFHQKTKCCTHT